MSDELREELEKARADLERVRTKFEQMPTKADLWTGTIIAIFLFILLALLIARYTIWG